MTPDRPLIKRRIPISALRTLTSPLRQPLPTPSPSTPTPGTSSTKVLSPTVTSPTLTPPTSPRPTRPVSGEVPNAESTRLPVSRTRPGPSPQPNTFRGGLFNGMPAAQRLWRETRARELHKLDALFSPQQPAKLITVFATLSNAIRDLEDQLVDCGDAAIRAQLQQELTDRRQDREALDRLQGYVRLIHLRLQQQTGQDSAKALEALQHRTLGQMLDCLREPDMPHELLVLGLREGVTHAHLMELHRAGLTTGSVRALRERCRQIARDYPVPTLDECLQFERGDPPEPALFDWAVQNLMPLPDLRAMMNAGLTADLVGQMPLPDARSRQVRLMTLMRDTDLSHGPGARRLCLRHESGELHHFLFFPCAPNSLVAEQIRKGLFLRRLEQHLGLDVMPDIHPHVHDGNGAPVYGMLIGCHDTLKTSTGATSDIDPRQPEIIQQYLALEWMAYLCQLDLRPDQLTWHHSPDGPRLRPTQAMDGLPPEVDSSSAPLRLVGMGMPELITPELARALESLDEKTLNTIADKDLRHTELSGLRGRTRRVSNALQGTYSHVERLSQPKDWTTPETLQTLGLDGTSARLKRLRDQTDTAAELQREARGCSLAAWHDLSARLPRLALISRIASVPIPTRRSIALPRQEPLSQHAFSAPRHQRSWQRRLQASSLHLDSPIDPELDTLAARYDAALASWTTARTQAPPRLVAGWIELQQSRQTLLDALNQLATKTLPDKAARTVARQVQRLQPPFSTEGIDPTRPVRIRHQALAALKPGGTAQDKTNHGLVTSLAKACDELMLRPLRRTPSDWIDLGMIETLATYTSNLDSAITALVAALQAQDTPVPRILMDLQEQTRCDVEGMAPAQALARQLNRLLAAPEPAPPSVQDLLQLVAHQHDLGAPEIAPALAAGCRVSDIVQARRQQVPLDLLLLAASMVQPDAKADLPLADLASELRARIDIEPTLLDNDETSQSSGPPTTTTPWPPLDRPEARQRLDNRLEWDTDTLLDDALFKATMLAAHHYEDQLNALARTDASEAKAWTTALELTRQLLDTLTGQLDQLAQGRPNKPAILLLIQQLQDQVRSEQSGLQRLGAFMDRLRHRLDTTRLAALHLPDLLLLAQQHDLQPDYLLQGLQAGWTPHEVLLAHQQHLPAWTLPASSHLEQHRQSPPGTQETPDPSRRLALAQRLNGRVGQPG